MRAATPAAMLALLFVVACAGDARAHSPSQKDWVARANAICAETDREIHALGGATSLGQLARVLEGTERRSRRQLAGLRELPAEPSQHTRVALILTAMERVNIALDELRLAARSGSGSRVEAAGDRLVAATRRADRLVAPYGLHQCLSNDG